MLNRKPAKSLYFYSTYDSIGVKFQRGWGCTVQQNSCLSQQGGFRKEYGGLRRLGETIVNKAIFRTDIGKYLFLPDAIKVVSFVILQFYIQGREDATNETFMGFWTRKLIPITSYQEQTQIVNFLDRKTEQIDELIRIKERRIELLQAQRTALINQAVTKGLDPNVEMKPSGVEWIGKIPVHWEVKEN